MTVIVGWIQHGTVYMGADSLGSDGYSRERRVAPKVFTLGEFIMGYTSSFRMGQLLQYKLVIPKHPEGMDEFEYMVKHLVEAIRTTLLEGGYASKLNNTERGGDFLVGYRGRLFGIGSDFQVGEAMHNFNSVGAGEYFANAALWATRNQNLEPYARLELAMQAAEEFCVTISSPFHYAEMSSDFRVPTPLVEETKTDSEAPK